jgi:hypothetical protein
MAAQLLRSSLLDPSRCDSPQTLKLSGAGGVQVEADEDVLWKPDERETDEEIAARGARFFQWLMQARPRGAVVAATAVLVGQCEGCACQQEAVMLPR